MDAGGFRATRTLINGHHGVRCACIVLIRVDFIVWAKMMGFWLTMQFHLELGPAMRARAKQVFTVYRCGCMWILNKLIPMEILLKNGRVSQVM